MNTSGALIGLVDHLQTMESMVTTILIEAAMKLATLTDAGVFLLVESRDGRRFSGKRHLCDAYLEGRLHPTDGDVELEVNPNITSVQERNAVDVKPEFDSARTNYTNPPRPRPSASRKRTSDSYSRSTFAKMPRTGNAEGSGWAEAHGGAANVVLRGDEPAAQDAAPFSDFPLGAQNEVQPVVDDSPEIIQAPHLATTSEMSSDNFRMVDPFSRVVLDEHNGAMVPLSRDLTHSAFAAHSTDFQLSSFPPLNVCNEKVKVLQSLPPSEVFIKGSVGNRLLMSVMYELGRSIAENCRQQGLTSPKDPAARNLLSHLFDAWIGDSLPHLLNSEVKPDQVRTAAGFLKHLTRMNFYCCFRKLEKHDKLNNSC